VLIQPVNLLPAVLTCDRMDEQWFKQQKRRAGVTNAEIGALRGRDHTVISKIVSGAQPMTLEWAQAFATALQVPLASVLEKSGHVAAEQMQSEAPPGFAEGDATPWVAKGGEDRRQHTIAEAFGQRPGVDIWRVGSTSMAGAGLMPGDYVLVDTHAAERVSAGDTVIAQVYARNGTARTVLRRWAPPVLISIGGAAETVEVHVVDNDNVVIRGKVIASWRV